MRTTGLNSEAATYSLWLNQIEAIVGHADFRHDEEMFNMWLARTSPKDAARRYEDGYK
jgi:hypothetical protein